MRGGPIVCRGGNLGHARVVGTVDDWVCINLDSFGDQQSLYGLYVNPLGIQGDSRIDDQGYTIEVRIPFKSLRCGSLYEKVQWQDDRFVPGRDLLETQRGFFVKISYLWRM